MNRTSVNPVLLRKYNLPVPRYTSYPTVPFWDNSVNAETWQGQFTKRFHEQNHTNGISLYIHLPFCEALCTYCGCNKKITTNHQVEEEYIQALEKEWKLYRSLMKQTPVIREVHLGGGTPTFFSPRNLQRLLKSILKTGIVHPQHEFSIEGHPNNTTPEHLKVLHSMGFRRISYGVQDTDSKVQQIINRIQPFENVKKATDNARAVGFTSINFDLIYGLPLQTEESIERTIKEVISLRPDRIAFYSYAHVPWVSRTQRLFNEDDLPDAETKLRLYMKGKELLSQHGYTDIGMDHFALEHDALYQARAEGKLHRNFMGYTTQNSGLLLGLGVSSISDAGDAFAQNKKALHDYYQDINNNRLAIQRGYVLSEEDQQFRKYILDISCRSKTSFRDEDLPLLREYSFSELRELEDDGLVTVDDSGVTVTPLGHFFLRNICSAFDLHLLRSRSLGEVKGFSKAV